MGKFHKIPGFMVLVPQNLGYFGLYHLITRFMVILFHKTTSI
jgi:hypothetical protein